MENEQLIRVLFSTLSIFIIKGVGLILLSLHMLFSLVLIRQTKIMLRVVEAKISPYIYAISIFHALFSFIVLISTALLL